MKRALLAALALWGCEQVDQDRPTPPRNDDVVAAYAQPTGTLDEDSAPRLIEALSTRIDEINALLELYGAVNTIPNELGNAQQAEGLAVRRDGLTASAGAWARITRKCPVSGEIVAFALFDEGGLEEILWGESDACTLADGDETQVFRGDLWLDFSGGAQGIIFLFAGEAVRGGEPARLDLDVQVTDTHVFLRQPVGDTSFLIGAPLGEDPDVLVRDAAGEWRCDSRSCSGPGGTLEWR